MAAVTVLKKQYPITSTSKNAGNALVFYGTGAANTDATLTTDAIGSDHSYRVSYSAATYSGSPTQTGVTHGIDSGLGAGYDVTVTTSSSNAKYSAYTPSVDLILGPGDAWTVTALAGGSGQTAAIVVVLLPL